MSFVEELPTSSEEDEPVEEDLADVPVAEGSSDGGPGSVSAPGSAREHTEEEDTGASQRVAGAPRSESDGDDATADDKGDGVPEEAKAEEEEGAKEEELDPTVLEAAMELKTQGNAAFGRGDHAEAEALYTRGIEVVLRRHSAAATAAAAEAAVGDVVPPADATPQGDAALPPAVERLSGEDDDGAAAAGAAAGAEAAPPEQQQQQPPLSLAQRDTSVAEERLAAEVVAGIPPAWRVQCAALYANRGACAVKARAWRRAVDDGVCALALDPDYTKALARVAGAREELDQLRAALADWEAVLERDPRHALARAAVKRLPPLVAEQEERDKAEMLGQLKSLGNSVLGIFGLSTDNFQFEKDPSTGGYSVGFKR